MKRLAEFVKERRKEVNLTQEEFAPDFDTGTP